MSQTTLIDLSNISVLAIDDDPVIRSVIRFALQRHLCRDVVQAHSGIEALDLCAGRSFDLLICDFQMSPMTGIEFLRELANTGLGEGWPVIMLSAETNPATIKEAQDLGVCAWVGKPVSVQTLIEQVGSVLRLRGQLLTSAPDPELHAAAERRHAHLMAALRTVEATVQGLSLRPREAAIRAHALRHVLNDVTDHARALDCGLAAMLAGRAIDLIASMEHDPAGTARGHAAVSRALATVTTAMKRVAHNRMTGDGGEAGLKLLDMIDGIIAPVRASLH
jgi:two-component system chemotaxis response regulator CheY